MLAVSIHLGVVPRSLLTEDEPRADDLSSYKLCAVGDLVLNRMRAFQGAVGLAPSAGLVSPDYIVLRPSGADGRFLHHLFRSSIFVGQMVARLRGIGSNETGSVRTPRINADDLGDIEVGLPSVERQRAIADFLDAETARIDALIEKKRRMIDLLDQRRTGVIHAAVAGLLPVAGERRGATLGWLESLPAGWGEVTLSLVAKLGSGHTPSRTRPEWWLDCTIPWITTGEVQQMRSDRIEEIFQTRERISALGLANSSAAVHPSGTVVLCRTASAGYSAIMGTDMATSQDFATWTCGPRLRPRYLLLCLRAMRPDLLGRLAYGSTHKTIYMPDIQALKIPLPSIDDQDRAVESAWQRLTRIDTACARLHEQLALLREHRQALITAAVTGELAVPGVAA
ncbi:MAG: restriction endonuclease subunit S [Acidimicrobiales bacterium]